MRALLKRRAIPLLDGLSGELDGDSLEILLNVVDQKLNALTVDDPEAQKMLEGERFEVARLTEPVKKILYEHGGFFADNFQPVLHPRKFGKALEAIRGNADYQAILANDTEAEKMMAGDEFDPVKLSVAVKDILYEHGAFIRSDKSMSSQKIRQAWDEIRENANYRTILSNAEETLQKMPAEQRVQWVDGILNKVVDIKLVEGKTDVEDGVCIAALRCDSAMDGQEVSSFLQSLLSPEAEKSLTFGPVNPDVPNGPVEITMEVYASTSHEWSWFYDGALKCEKLVRSGQNVLNAKMLPSEFKVSGIPVPEEIGVSHPEAQVRYHQLGGKWPELRICSNPVMARVAELVREALDLDNHPERDQGLNSNPSRRLKVCEGVDFAVERQPLNGIISSTPVKSEEKLKKTIREKFDELRGRKGIGEQVISAAAGSAAGAAVTTALREGGFFHSIIGNILSVGTPIGIGAGALGGLGVAVAAGPGKEAAKHMGEYVGHERARKQMTDGGLAAAILTDYATRDVLNNEIKAISQRTDRMQERMKQHAAPDGESKPEMQAVLDRYETAIQDIETTFANLDPAVKEGMPYIKPNVLSRAKAGIAKIHR